MIHAIISYDFVRGYFLPHKTVVLFEPKVMVMKVPIFRKHIHILVNNVLGGGNDHSEASGKN